MADRLPQKHRPDSSGGQPRSFPRIVRPPDELLNRIEARELLEVSNWTFYQLLEHGRLRQVQRTGYQPYYLKAEVLALRDELGGQDGNGAPPHAPNPGGRGPHGLPVIGTSDGDSDTSHYR